MLLLLDSLLQEIQDLKRRKMTSIPDNLPSNSFVARQTEGTSRRRMYSWSRPSRQPGRKSRMQSETTIAGQATLAFARDGSWFQGKVISPEKDAYTVSGRRIGDGRGISFTSSSNNSISSPSSTSPIASSIMRDSSYLMSKKSIVDSPTCSPSLLSRKGMIDSCCSSSRGDSPTIARSPSEVDSLDSELIARTLASIDNEEGEVGYEMSIMDYETGMNHSPQGVRGKVDSSGCNLQGDSLSFSSRSQSKGVLADKVILGHLGPGLVTQDLVVFQGPFSFKYSDPVCYPRNSSNAGQWCL